MANHLHFFKCVGALIVFCISTAVIPRVSLAGSGDLPQGKPMSVEEIVKSGQSCEECHEKITPRIFREHMEGEHGMIGVSCADCHGDDHRDMLTATARAACEQCHPDETVQFAASGHSKSWASMKATSLYSSQTEVMRRNGCETCHLIGYGDDDGRCDLCHRKHSFAKIDAADPRSCAPCHMASDFLLDKVYQHSAQHFTPLTCAGCHMAADNHNASENLKQLSAGLIASQCAQCHDASFISQWQKASAIVAEQGRQYLARGRQIVNMLRDSGRLYPDPRSDKTDTEPAQEEPESAVHPYYRDTSRAEKLYYDLKKYIEAHDLKGAYHQDFMLGAPDILLAVQQQMKDLEAEALLLQELAVEKVELTPIKGPVAKPETRDLFRLTYESSLHGILPGNRQKPSCETCHGTGEYRKSQIRDWAPICSSCHLAALVEQFVTDLAATRIHADQLRHKADETVAKLIGKKVLGKDDTGNLILIDDYKQNQLIADMLLARLVFHLNNLDRSLKIMTVSFGHGNPAYALFFTNDAVQGDLIEIRDASVKLMRMKKVFVDVPALPFGPLPQDN